MNRPVTDTRSVAMWPRPGSVVAPVSGLSVVVAITIAISLALMLTGCVVPPKVPGDSTPSSSEANGANGPGSRTGDASRTNASGDLVTASDEPANAKRAKLRFELAAAYYGRGQLTDALDNVKLALSADPTLAEGQNLRGLIYAGLGDSKLAEESFNRALRLSPRDPDTMHNFGWFMCQQRRYDEANKLFDQALQIPLYRGVTNTLRAQGVCQARAGDLSGADKTLTRSYDLDPSNPTTALNLSEVLLRTGDYPRARFYMQRVNAIPQLANAQTLWLAARIEARSGNPMTANQIGLQLRSRYPEAPETRMFDQGQFNE
jgi:type IV pilus assembly protein PilF